MLCLEIEFSCNGGVQRMMCEKLRVLFHHAMFEQPCCSFRNCLPVETFSHSLCMVKKSFLFLLHWILVECGKIDGMFKGMYHGKQCHAADLVHVLQRAWDAGVERIIVRLSSQNLFI